MHACMIHASVNYIMVGLNDVHVSNAYSKQCQSLIGCSSAFDKFDSHERTARTSSIKVLSSIKDAWVKKNIKTSCLSIINIYTRTKYWYMDSIVHNLYRISHKICPCFSLIVLQTFNISWSIFALYWTQYERKKSKPYFKLWTQKRCPIPRPCRRAMRRLFWVLLGKGTVRYWDCNVLCLVVVIYQLLWIHVIFTHILWDCFTDTGAIIWSS